MLRFEELPEINSERYFSLNDLEGEVWKRLFEYTMVSNYGRIKSEESLHKEFKCQYSKTFIHRVRKSPKGYVMCFVEGKLRQVHRMVAIAFLPNPLNKPQVDHINTQKDDNRLCNLKWVTQEENSNNSITRVNVINNKGKYHPIVMLDAYGNYVSEFETSIHAARLLGVKNSNIYECVRNFDKGRTSKGYRFLYKEDYDKEKKYPIIEYKTGRMASTIKLPVKTSVALFKNGKIEKAFLTIKDAACYCNCSEANICALCRKHRNSFLEENNKRRKNSYNLRYYNDLTNEEKELFITLI